MSKKRSIRFAIKPRVSPNVELKFSKSVYDDLALSKPIIIEVGDEKLKASFLKLQVAFKEEILRSDKDMEDARHIRLVAKGHLDEHLINDYKKELRR